MTTIWDQLNMIDSLELLAFKPYANKRKRQKLFLFFLALQDEFESIRGSILHRSPGSPLPDLDTVISELLAEEERLNTQAGQLSTPLTLTVFATPHRQFNNSRQWKHCGPQSSDECRYRHDLGHWAINCPKLGSGVQIY
ncbi:hypothetical protein IFM89_029943 [Coptis chinensis]|uniref:Uncharacterized protein n=1 Tax=Coptis chinensis TaxID=261450 RepID=A0A835HKT4_9MAGN|nr:hypothetical protein IFM89_029943 [Coptis chinensis]